jgi:hypothetical protein
MQHLQVLRWTGKFLGAQPDTLGSVFAQAAASLHCGSTSSSAVGAGAVLCLYDHMRACLKLRAAHGVSAKARKEVLLLLTDIYHVVSHCYDEFC